ncbi:phospholipid-transporting ATPase ABCA1-like isoform X2 [Teleopsis dalmanni]|uniref:phospholipid-transporting ATPase ABCA1-like isoform X2 n=1 Tax=Teleopsis dalmanni TaxID=139649 RepID=UPI0018CCC3F1|nr:phospholipid-transporting ATPase ABCA1-like isoform X2 [Teleopsis dalmanni]
MPVRDLYQRTFYSDIPEDGKEIEISNSKKFGLLFFKLATREWRDWVSKILVIFSPSIFLLYFIVLRILISVEKQPVQKYDPIDLEDSWISMLQLYTERKDNLTLELLSNNIMTLEDIINNFPHDVYIPRLIVSYAPGNREAFVQIMELAAEKLNRIELKSFDTCKQLRENMIVNFYLAGVCFDEEILISDPTESKYLVGIYPNRLNFSLIFPSELRNYHDSFIGGNWKSDVLFDTRAKLEDRLSEDNDGGYVGYVREGFIPLQDAISSAYIRLSRNLSEIINVNLQRFPYSSHDFDELTNKIEISFPLAIILGYVFPIINLSKHIMYDDKKGVMAAQKNLGIPYWLQTSVSFFNGFLNMFVGSFFVSLLIVYHWNKGAGICGDSSWSTILFLFTAFNLASVAFCMLVLSFISRVECSHMLLVILWIITYLPYMQKKNVSSENFSSVIYVYLFSNSAMGEALTNLQVYEEYNYGIHWENLFASAIINSKFRTGSLILILLAQTVVYMVIALSVQKISFITKKKWNLNTATIDTPGSTYEQMTNRFRKTEVIEVDVGYKKVVVELRRVTKVYDKIPVLHNVSMTMCEGEITVLMGHNSCGKTTLLSMIVGLIPPTSGTIIVNDYNICKHPELGLKNIGISVGETMLFTNLTVREQLSFFCSIKGMDFVGTQLEVEKYMAYMKITDKSEWLTQTLSTGVKQYLEVCCALIGGSKVVILDEPSIGMDMVSRKLLWKLLLEEKFHRTIILTTQSCDEADSLGDRIAMISGGKLQCCGSSYFLKNMYCSGYRLTIIRGAYCVTEHVTAIISEYIPDVQPEYVLGNEISYILDEKYLLNFPELLDKLYAERDTLNILSWSISEKSLHDVFMQRGSEVPSFGERKRHTQIMSGISSNEHEHSKFLTIFEYEPLKGCQLWISQTYAMVLKRAAFQKSYKALTLLQFTTPFIFPLLSLFFTKLNIHRHQITSMTYNINQYSKSTTVLHTAHNLETTISDMSDMYRENVFWYSKGHRLEVCENDDFEPYIIRKIEDRADFVNHDYLVAASFKNDAITAWFNNYPLHTAPLSLNMVYTAIAQTYDTNSYITVSFEPLHFYTKFTPTLDTLWSQESIGYSLPRNVALCFAIMWPFRCTYFTEERVSGFKLLQVISGLKKPIYWLSSFITNMVFITMQSVIIVLISICFIYSNFGQFNIAIWYLLVLIISGATTMTLTYVISLCFDDSQTVYGIVVISLLLNIVCHCLHFEVFYRGEESYGRGDVLHVSYQWLFCILPFISLTRALEKIFRIGNLSAMCRDRTISTISKYMEDCKVTPNCCEPLHPFQWGTGIKREITCLMFTFTISWIIIILYENKYIKSEFKMSKKLKHIQENVAIAEYESRHSDKMLQVEENVISEKLKIDHMTHEDYFRTPLICNRISLYRKGFITIKELCLTI